MNILGISCFYHDSAAAVIKDGMICNAAQEERFTRIKHDANFPSNAINFCLDASGLSAVNIDYVIFYEKPFKKFERILKTIISTYPKSGNFFTAAAKNWLLKKLWIKSIIREQLNMPEEKILFVDHHTAHAASSFFLSPYNEAALLTIDGVGEWATGTMGTGTDNQIELTQQMSFPHSLGLLYSTFTAFLGVKVNNGEYKVIREGHKDQFKI